MQQQHIILILCLLIAHTPSKSHQYKNSLRSFIIKDLKILRDLRLAYEMEEQKRDEIEKRRQEELRREQEEADEMRRKIIQQYLLPRAGATSLLNDLYSRF